MKNPLIRRIPREIFSDWKKYLALFLLLTAVIGFTSGVFVANDSMEISSMESFEKYNIENGHFNLKEKPSAKLLNAFKKEGISIYPQFYKDLVMEGDTEVITRTFIMRDKVNKACLMRGNFPAEKNEIAIDRMFADNNNISVNDNIKLNGKTMRVCGLVALSDYSSLFKKNTDFMFDALTFNIALVTQEGYEAFDVDSVYQYAFKYNEPPKDVNSEKKRSDRLMKHLAILAMTGGLTNSRLEFEELSKKGDPSIFNPYLESINELTDYVPEYSNQAIHFAPNDFGHDRAMGEVLLLVFTVVLAFIFAIMESNTIIHEAPVIGTLRSLGYTKRELLCHYMTIPIAITLISAIIGNILGYTFFKDNVASLYYNSYSLAEYVVIFNSHAFISTTVYPVLIVISVNLLVLIRKLRFSPLQFLRNDLSSSRSKKAVPLPKLSFINRFRLRILLQNAGGYFTLFLGIFFVTLLLRFAIGMPSTLKEYQNDINKHGIADYQYVLKDYKNTKYASITVKEPSAEKFSITSLKSVDGPHIDEEITIYGYMKNSKYFHIDEMDIFISNGYGEKFGIKEGDTVTLKENYSDKTYDFKVAGVYNLPGSMAIFMPNNKFNKTFDYEYNHFSGYISEKPIKEINNGNIHMLITKEDTSKLTKQLDHSMGSFMNYFSVICLISAMLIIFILTKIIIEHNAISISMIKVLGYTNREINLLYIRLTTVFVILSTVLASFLSSFAVKEIWKQALNRFNGWLPFCLTTADFIKLIAMVIFAYLVVALIDIRRIKKIPMAEALKNVE